jgi:hypothetical protein
MEKAKEFLTYIIKAIVTKPESVDVESKTDEMGILLTLHVAQEDMGIVIGKQGATAQILRGLMRVVGGREKASIGLKIFDPNPKSTQRFDMKPVHGGDPLEPLF